MEESEDLERPDGRSPDQLREVSFKKHIAPNATGSALCSFGNTSVICAATITNGVPRWMREKGVSRGWATAEYSMLPYATLERKRREVTRGKPEGRTMEIQRLIGRSIRAVLDLEKLGERTLWVDCDVLRADGGTRTASITGAYLACKLAVEKLLSEQVIEENPFTDSISAISVGIYKGWEILDLNYPEDRDASVDFNVVMTGAGHYVEVQGSGEEAIFTEDQLRKLLDLAKAGCQRLTRLQAEAMRPGAVGAN